MDRLFVAWQLTALASGLLSGGAMIFFFVKYPSTRVHPGMVLMCIFLSVSIASIMRVALHAWYIVLDPDDTRGPIPATLSRVANEELGHDTGALEPYVPFFFWCYFFFSTSGTLWFLMLALDLIFSLSNPFLPFNADNVKHHIYAWPVSLIYCLIFKYILSEFQSHPTANVVLYFDLPAYIVLLYISGALVQAWRRSRILETHAHNTTRRMAKRILPYLGVFALHTIIALAIYISQLGTEFGSMTPNAFDQLSLVLETLALFALFCHDAGVFRAQVIAPNGADATQGGNNSGNPSRTTTTQIQAGASTLTSTSGGAAASNSNNRDKIDVSNKLRMDIMRYTSKGIMKSIEMAQAAENAAVGSISGEFTGSDTEAALDVNDCYSGVSYHDYNHVESMGVVVYGLKNSTMLNFRDCAPKIFHRIRAQFNIDQDFYRESFDPSRILSEHGSEGKSGNIFYFTANKQFMVKSVPKEEFDTLRAILPHYHEYLQSNPQSMLCRYFGCHSISLPIGKRRMYFVVMQNLFNEGPVDQRFDLKGNRDRRQAVSATTMEGLIQVAKDRQPIGQLMMDIDFLKISTGVSLSYANTAMQQDQLCSDFVFLASRGIIDYSILLGVRYDSPEKREMRHGGFSSHDQEEVYYVGIVDMLQRYNWRWTVQRWLLGLLLCKDTHDVSAVPPEEYATRLSEFVREKLFNIQMNSSVPSFRNGRGIRPASSVHMDSGDLRSSCKSSGEQSYFSCRSSQEEQSFSSPRHSKLRVGSIDSSDVHSIDMQHLSVFSADSGDIRGSLSSSPSVAYSSVCESPVMSESRRSSTFFV
ncbi:phosphatidylinositol-4-phosphate 5-kinase-like protein 1 [Phytophthora boehmeriae]|uniref:Phosphatidylinositol-4-phosphate 5-kinase-like protein 1 n=1 Tax=Phytophthora boehmeriae TaxID=109152 RepID=A0A8T1WHE5_9STRA|nr:phosphatidylinositol-4-phosphate 5-kinase-like protein 1 [Phytophthora boehmeriae]